MGGNRSIRHTRKLKDTDIFKYPEQPYSFIIWKDGSVYYAKYGFNGKIACSGTVAADIINWALGNGTGEVFCRKAIYYMDSLVIIDANDTLRFEHGSEIRPTTNTTIFYVKENGQLIGGFINTSGLGGGFNSDAIMLGEGETYWHTEPQRTLVSDVLAKGAAGVGTGTFLHLHPQDDDAIHFCNFEKFFVEGFERGIYIDCQPTVASSNCYVNANQFDKIYLWDQVYPIHMIADVAKPGTYIDGNFLDGIHIQRSANLVTALLLEGAWNNRIVGNVWDLAGAQAAIRLDENTKNNHVELCNVASQYIYDLGWMNEVKNYHIDAGGFPTNEYSFNDEFARAALDASLWTNAGTGSATIITEYNGLVRVRTGALTGNSHVLNWGIRQIYQTWRPRFYVRVQTPDYAAYNVIIALREATDNDRVYIRLSTDLGNGGEIGCVNGGVATTQAFTHTHAASWFLFQIICNGSTVAFWRDATLLGTISTNIPTGAAEPYFYVEARENVLKDLYVEFVDLKQYRYVT